MKCGSPGRGGVTRVAAAISGCFEGGASAESGFALTGEATAECIDRRPLCTCYLHTGTNGIIMFLAASPFRVPPPSSASILRLNHSNASIIRGFAAAGFIDTGFSVGQDTPALRPAFLPPLASGGSHETAHRPRRRLCFDSLHGRC